MRHALEELPGDVGENRQIRALIAERAGERRRWQEPGAVVAARLRHQLSPPGRRPEPGIHLRRAGHLIVDRPERARPQPAGIASLATMKIIDGESGRFSASGRCNGKAPTT